MVQSISLLCSCLFIDLHIFFGKTLFFHTKLLVPASMPAYLTGVSVNGKYIILPGCVGWWG